MNINTRGTVASISEVLRVYKNLSMRQISLPCTLFTKFSTTKIGSLVFGGWRTQCRGKIYTGLSRDSRRAFTGISMKNLTKLTGIDRRDGCSHRIVRDKEEIVEWRGCLSRWPTSLSSRVDLFLE